MTKTYDIKNRIKKTYPEDPWTYNRIYRPLSLWLTIAFIKMKFSANFVTFVSCLVCLAGGFMIAFGEPYLMFLGSLLFFLFIIIDCCDGQIARYEGKVSASGDLYDWIGHFVLDFSVFASITFKCFTQDSHWSIILAGITVTFLSAQSKVLGVLYYYEAVNQIIRKGKNYLDTIRSQVEDANNNPAIDMKKLNRRGRLRRVMFILSRENPRTVLTICVMFMNMYHPNIVLGRLRFSLLELEILLYLLLYSMQTLATIVIKKHEEPIENIIVSIVRGVKQFGHYK